MFNYDDLDVEKELSQIPPEYQDVFRQALEGELAELREDATDTDILHYLRRRRDDFRRGGFIRPDGRPGVVIADPELLYEQGLMATMLGQNDGEELRERRRTRLKLAGFALLAVLFVVFILRGRSQRAGVVEVSETPAVTVAGEATATPELPAVSGAEETLQTIGGLGGALTIGRPGVIELHYRRTEEVIALAIDPSRPTPRGELRYNEAAMASENPVAVWLFGTVVNYGIGLPDSLVRNLQTGDRVALHTDTGASLMFIVSATRRAAGHDAAVLLSQNRVGLTLFALPAVAEDDVFVALASYDVASEEQRQAALQEMGQSFALPGWGEVQVEDVLFGQASPGAFRIEVQGAATHDTTLAPGASLMLSLTAGAQQTPATSLQIEEDGRWQATFTLPDTAQDAPLFGELRALPGGAPALVRLGHAPRFWEWLEVRVGEATLGDDDNVRLQLEIHNAGEGAVFVGEDFVQIALEGGDAYETLAQAYPGLQRQLVPALPQVIEAGETLGLMAALPLPPAAQVLSVPQAQARPDAIRLQIGAGLWEVSGFGSLPAGRQP